MQLTISGVYIFFFAFLLHSKWGQTLSSFPDIDFLFFLLFICLPRFLLNNFSFFLLCFSFLSNILPPFSVFALNISRKIIMWYSYYNDATIFSNNIIHILYNQSCIRLNCVLLPLQTTITVIQQQQQQRKKHSSYCWLQEIAKAVKGWKMYLHICIYKCIWKVHTEWGGQWIYIYTHIYIDSVFLGYISTSVCITIEYTHYPG